MTRQRAPLLAGVVTLACALVCVFVALPARALGLS
jgi:hypothetical protein